MKTKQDKPEINFTKWIVIVLVSLVIGSIAGIFILAKYSALDKESFGREVGNMCLQIISVGVVGTILSLLLAKYNQQKDENIKKNELIRISNENTNQFKKDILHQLNKIYSDTKSIRRMLRAKAFTMPYYKAITNDDAKIYLEIYDNALEEINTLQLQLEIILKEIDMNKKNFRDYNKINDSITTMEKYLGNAVKEYEKNRAAGTGDSPFLIIKDLKSLRQMLDHASENNQFTTGFVEPYKNAITLVRNELLNEPQISNEIK